MILGDGGQMLMVTEKQDHEYLENGKRYQEMSKSRPPKTCTFYVYISYVLCSIFIIWRFSRDFKIQNGLAFGARSPPTFKQPMERQGQKSVLSFGARSPLKL